MRIPLSCRQFTALLTKLLAFVLAGFGLLTIAFTIRIVIRTYSPVIQWDQWQIINTLMQSGGHPTLRHLWAQHNEHRVLTGRLLCFADLFWFRGRNVSLFVEILFLQLCHLFVFAWVLRRFSRLSGAVYATVTGFLAYCLFSPLQIENFDWAFQVVFVLTSFAATVCFAATLWYSEDVPTISRRRQWIVLALCSLAAFIAEGSEAHGLLAWPVLIFLTFALRFRERDRWMIAAVAGVAIAAYLIGYESPNPPHALSDALSRPRDVLKFLLTYLGSSWDAHLPNGSAWPAASESITLLAIAGTLLCSAWCLRRPSAFSPIQIFCIANSLFSLGTAVMTALGRLRFGIPMALASRYQTPALVFWGSLAALLAVTVDWIPPRRLLAGQTVLLVLLVAAAGRWASMAQSAAARQYQLEEAWNAVVHDRYDDPAAAPLFYSLGMLKEFVPYLRRHHWGPAGEINSLARIQRTRTSPKLKGYRQLPQACLGQLDGVRRTGLTSVLLTGSVSDRLNPQPADRVAMASGTGELIAYGDLDVKAGWKINTAVPADGIYHVFLLLGGTKSACPLQNELRIRNRPEF